MVTKCPAIQWFGVAAFASAAVGKGINYTGQCAQDTAFVLGNLDPLVSRLPDGSTIGGLIQQQMKSLHEGFSYGNQLIFKNIFAVFHTYLELGIPGLIQIRDYDKAYGNHLS